MDAGVNYAVLRYSLLVMNKTVDPSMKEGPGDWMTVGRLAKVAGVGVETIRYYQGRGLLPIPKTAGSFRRYPASMIQRIGFIKHAQSLGFSLDEVKSLLDLEDGRNRRAIQTVTRRRLDQIDEKVGDLERMRGALRDMLVRCEETGEALPCPIIAALMTPLTPSE
ncbi:MerR family transcriptional regulator [Pseudomonas aeruginosa]|uniref:MerR family transcriptional regulator n=1 Tax=Pseudomonas aeruginosa TaxID=287 RepID=UPI0021565638|nr:MerR family transcriptional regulator [Pseudomonas aeruginosa]